MSGWIPRGVSWLRTIVLICIATATLFTLGYFGLYGGYLSYETKNPVFLLFMTLVALIVPFIFYAYIHCWLLGNKPDGWAKKIPSPSSIKESVLSFVVLIFGFVASAIITSPFVPNRANYYDGYRYLQAFEWYGLGVIWTWMIVSLYMFHGYDLISNPPSKKSTDKSKPETPKSKIDPIDRELNHLKHKTGIHFRETPKK